MDTMPIGQPRSHAEVYQGLKEVLEEIFPPETLLRAQKAKSAVYERWTFCQKMIKQNGRFTFSPDLTEIITMRESLLDCRTFAWLSGGYPEQIEPGTIDQKWDQEVLKKIRGTATDSAHYEDMMVELSAAAWYKHQGFPIQLVPRKGWPDVWANKWPDVEMNSWLDREVGDPHLKQPLFVECKRLNPRLDRGNDARERIKARIEEHLKKANNQIKSAAKELGTDCYGIVVFDIASLFSITEMQDPQVSTGMSQLDQVRGIAQNVLSNGCSSINDVVFTWDGFVWQSESSGFAHCQFIPYNTIIEHAKPVVHRPNLPLYKGRGLDLRLQYRPVDNQGKLLYEGQPTHLEIRWAGMESLGHSSWVGNQ